MYVCAYLLSARKQIRTDVHNIDNMHKLLMVRQCVRYRHLTFELSYVLDCRGGNFQRWSTDFARWVVFQFVYYLRQWNCFCSLAKACEADKSMDLLWAAAILALHGL